MTELVVYKCAHCHGQIVGTLDRCPWCGYWFKEHPEMRIMERMTIRMNTDTVETMITFADYAVSESTDGYIRWCLRTETVGEFSDVFAYFKRLKEHRNTPCSIRVGDDTILEGGLLETIKMESMPGQGLLTCIFRGKGNVTCRHIGSHCES